MTFPIQTAARQVCEFNAIRGPGCVEPLGTPGACSACRGQAEAALISRCRHEAASWDDAAHILNVAAGIQCFVCHREPTPRGLTFENLTVCAACAAVAPGRARMNDITDQEAAAGMDAVDRAGAYLASLDKFDLRDLDDTELAKFNAHFIAGFADSMRLRAGTVAPF